MIFWAWQGFAYGVGELFGGGQPAFELGGLSGLKLIGSRFHAVWQTSYAAKEFWQSEKSEGRS
jgi:hypothetical protein